MEQLDIKSQDLPELKKTVEGLSEKPFRAKQIYEWLHKKQADSFQEMTNLSVSLREKLERNCQIVSLKVLEVQTSKLDGTQKYLFALPDGNVVESVLMKYHHGNSVCISSQVGCKMGCRFCASTIGGWTRNLMPSEMLDQVYKIQKLSKERVSNVVVMGTGEPLDNYDNLLRFIRMLSDEKGLHISQRNITVSTCGIVPKMYDLAQEDLQITLAISLHASNQQKREQLMPIARKYSLEELMKACRNYFEKTGRRLTFEYSLVGGENDSQEDAEELARLIKGLNCHVNLIPVNPIKERSYVQSDKKVIANFQNKLEKYQINVTIRREMGRDTRRMKSYSVTDVGQKRQVNQDYIFASEEPVGNLPNLFVVADGMGGHKAGDFASSYAVQILLHSILEDENQNPIIIIRHAIEEANRKVLEEANLHEEMSGMGTTMVLVTIVDDYAYVANVGDSRLYLIEDRIVQITKDHSLVEEMVRRGLITREDAKHHPDKNIITRVIGIGPEVEVDFFDIHLKENSRLLLCSDGLSNMVSDEEIWKIAETSSDLKEMGLRLVSLANENGGKDNIAVVLVQPDTKEVEVC